MSMNKMHFIVVIVCCFLTLSSCEEEKEVVIEQKPSTLTYVYNGEKFYEAASDVEEGIFVNKVIKNLFSGNKELFIRIDNESGNVLTIFDSFSEVKEELGLENNPFDVPIDLERVLTPSENSRQELFKARLTFFDSYGYTPTGNRIKINISSKFIDEGEVLDVDLANVKNDAGDYVNFRNRPSSMKYHNDYRSCNFCTDRIVTQILDVETGKKTNFFHKAGESFDVANLSWVGFDNNIDLVRLFDQ